MKIIITGAYAIGTHLAKLLTRNNEDITLIDQDEDRLVGISNEYDLLTMQAPPNSIKALKEAAAAGTPADLEETEEPDKLKRKGIGRVLIIVVAIISLILFILTEDMRLPMEFIDEWTIWMIILLVIALVLALITRKVTEEPDDEQDPTEGTQTS